MQYFNFINISYFAKNIIISGCLVYPVEQLCFENLNWANLKLIQELGIGIEIFNKSYSSYNGSLSKTEYIKDFNWIATWFTRNFKEFTNIILLIILCFLIPILISKKYKKSNKDIINLTSFFIFCFLTFILFLKSPVIRMYHHFFVYIILVCAIYFYLKILRLKLIKNFLLY